MYDKNNPVHEVYFNKVNNLLKEQNQKMISGENEINLIAALLDLNTPLKECVSSLLELRETLSKK